MTIGDEKPPVIHAAARLNVVSADSFTSAASFVTQDDSHPHEPWYVGLEMSNFTHQLHLDEECPATRGRYDTEQGYWSQ